MLEPDFNYPEKLHDKHKDFPFMFEDGKEKLVPSLGNKKNYITHIRALDQALKHGLVLNKV